MKTTEELRARFSNEYGIGWENDEGEPDIDYVHFLEELLLSQSTESAGVGEQLEPEGECSHCDGTGYMAENLDKSELIKCEYCSPQQPSEGEINDIFNVVATHTTEEGILLMSEQEFKWAIESLNVQGEAQQRYEKAVKLLSSKRYPLLGITEVLKIAAGLRN